MFKQIKFHTPNLANTHPLNRSNSPFNLKEFIKKGDYKKKKQEKLEVPKDIESRIKLREINESQKNFKKNRRCSESTKIMFFDKKTTELQSRGSAENLRRDERRRTKVEDERKRGKRGESLGEEWLLTKSTFYTGECECERRKTFQKKRCRCEMEEGREERSERKIKYYWRNKKKL